ncbi:glyoxylase-like metal-dependent hydrolase (beta-lactamase superfamily II) [Chitinophaga niastensis]|uniref:Glyoxylase-like metal-dependent hydrolase (Beta-lactamase superfamily II) n=1 Tax=Chitinophaga niastensis TaxID=536980 RepID=A0A2P8HHN8_CHINA|nr:MBL fold metallo-hydrolase [Chitinophaga niastensis]PSL45717.1 glyoxylase-like metal-dependent hydrolase (beta-lactamase superfamily II) [Chitinophaga niastensis]
MDIKQFEDKGLAHYSYAVYSSSTSEMVLIDPSRNITPYLDYAKSLQAKITGVIETHPHADFISGHLELHHTTGATLYCSKLLGAAYPHTGFDEGDEINMGAIKLKALHTPGHSPDSISIVLVRDGRDKAVFTGDTLFIGDCGRPDLREDAGNISTTKEVLAKNMYHTLREKLMVLADDVIIYPAHGAGTLCGKSLSTANYSTMGAEKLSNWSLQQYTEAEFVGILIAEQPFVPKYFPYNVSLNKKGAPDRDISLKNIPVHSGNFIFDKNIIIVDARPAHIFKQGFLPNAINLQDGDKFETWLGSIIAPDEAFYLVAEDEAHLQTVMEKTTKIGYEPFIAAAVVFSEGTEKMIPVPLSDFKAHRENYVIVDVRNTSEVQDHPIFDNAISIPLHQLRERISEIPVHKPVVVHCAGGYRSAAGSSIVANALRGKTNTFDLGEAINEF